MNTKKWHLVSCTIFMLSTLFLLFILSSRSPASYGHVFTYILVLLLWGLSITIYGIESAIKYSKPKSEHDLQVTYVNQKRQVYVFSFIAGFVFALFLFFICLVFPSLKILYPCGIAIYGITFVRNLYKEIKIIKESERKKSIAVIVGLYVLGIISLVIYLMVVGQITYHV